MTQRETVLIILCLIPATSTMLAFWISIRYANRKKRNT